MVVKLGHLAVIACWLMLACQLAVHAQGRRSAPKSEASAVKILHYTDAVYEPNIKTVLFAPADRMHEATLVPSLSPIAQTTPLVLKFDELFTDQAENYMVRILHCTADWKPSDLNELEYMVDFNEFTINDFEFSGISRVPYTHYTFVVPRVKLPGNYLLVVYRNYDQKDIVLSRRFMVLAQQLKIISESSLSTGVAQRYENHQINFVIDYSNFPVLNPLIDLKVVIRQNRRWDNALWHIRPTMVREDLSQLVYRHFGLETNFKAGNEFRFFDMRSIRYSGQNIEQIKSGPNGHDAFLYIDKPRKGLAYGITNDLNGGYLIQNRDLGDSFTEADYVRVHFFLEMEEAGDEPIYIGGQFCDWNYTSENRMEYMPSSGLYTASMLLKQGLYDYNYYIPDDPVDPNRIEGNHFETRNDYEILVYGYSQQYRADLLIGYEYIPTP